MCSSQALFIRFKRRKKKFCMFVIRNANKTIIIMRNSVKNLFDIVF